MPEFRPATCPNCGANISILPSEKDGKCPYCNTVFLIEDAVRIFNYNYNIVNNIQTDKVVVQQEDPEYFKALRDLKVELNKLLSGIRPYQIDKDYPQYKTKEAERYFDKCDILRYSAYWNFNYAYGIPYSEATHVWDYNPWASQMTKAIKVCNDPQLKSKLIEDYEKMCNLYNNKIDSYKKAGDEFYKTISGDLHGVWIAYRKYKSESPYIKQTLLWSYDDSLYAIGKSYVTEVNNVVHQIEGGLEAYWVNADTVYLREHGKDTFSIEAKLINEDIKWPFDDNEIVYFNRDLQVKTILKIDTSNIAESYNRAVRLCRDECIYCGSPLEYSGLIKKLRCSGHCGCKIKFIYNRSTNRMEQLCFER